MGRNEEEKKQLELMVFREFISESDYELESDPIQLNPDIGEPDIGCVIKNRGYINFEITKLCSEKTEEEILDSMEKQCIKKIEETLSKLPSEESRKFYDKFNNKVIRIFKKTHQNSIF